MKDKRRNQRGFGTVEILVAVFAVAAIGAVGWFAYQQNRTKVSDAANSNGKPSAGQNEKPDGTPKPASSKTFTSTTGGFSFKYPAGWEVVDNPDTPDDPGEYIYIYPPSYDASSDVNNFSAMLLVTDKPSSLATPSHGSAQKLPNGLHLWVRDADSVLPRDDGTICVPLSIVSPDAAHFYHSLPNGKNLALDAGYCPGQGQTTNLPYQAQVSSADWRKLVDIIGSITFN